MAGSGELSCAEKAEIMRKKSRYRELILSGRLRVPRARAAQLIGPDCLYHLYSVDTTGNPDRRARGTAQARRKKRSRRSKP